MNLKKKLFAFLTSGLGVSVLFTIAAFAKEDKSLDGKSLTFVERLEYALQGTVTGLLMVFSVLALLWGIVSLMKVFFYDIPRKKKEKQEKLAQAVKGSIASGTDGAYTDAVSAPEQNADEGELLAVITAAVSAMIESEEYSDEFSGGFRVVSFKRNNTVAGKSWNKK